jgi:uncharacterized protein with PQ loop repeat
MLPLSMWIAQIFYFICFVPQIIDNFRVKSGRGISELLLIFYLNSYLFLLFYIFCMNLPWAYKIMVPLQALATVILILQRLVFDNSSSVKSAWFLYAANVVMFFFFIPYALKNPLGIGSAFGWFFTTVASVAQLPQVVKVFQEKSVVGFSFLFVLFTGVAAMIEFAAAVLAHLPMQTLFSAFRGIVIFLIFCSQFWMYRKS